MLPAAELASLRSNSHEWSDLLLNERENPLATIAADLLDLETEFQVAEGTVTCLKIRGFDITYDADAETLSSCGTATHLRAMDGVVRLRVLLDRTSIEVYANDGRVYIPRVVFPDHDNRSHRHDLQQGHDHGKLPSSPRVEVELGAGLTLPHASFPCRLSPRRRG